MKTKLLLYIGGGVLALVGGYFVYKRVISESAKKSVSGMVSGIGGQGLKMIGFDPDNIPFIGKQESAAAVEKMRASSPHSPKSAAAVRGAGTGRTALSLAAGHGAPKSPRARPVSYRPQAIGREATPLTSRGGKPTITARPTAISRPKVTVPARTTTAAPARAVAPTASRRVSARRRLYG